jgi:hypothetical protein
MRAERWSRTGDELRLHDDVRAVVPDALVGDLQMAEHVGFDFSVTSDHYQPSRAVEKVKVLIDAGAHGHGAGSGRAPTISGVHRLGRAGIAAALRSL